MKVTARLKYESRVHGAELEELESIIEAGTRDRELTLTKLYARLNNSIRKKIENNEGVLKVQQRKRTPYNRETEYMLFDGIRDMRLRANWVQTPQPIVIKLQSARCLRDKISKGDYIIRVCALERLVDFKLYYKFLEYGNRVKDQRRVEEDKKTEKMIEKMQN